MAEEKTLTKRQQQALATRRRIQDKAMELIRERGYENITISDICGAAGVSNGNFYHYFSSKDDVLLFCFESFDKDLEEEFSQRSFDSWLDALRAVIYRQTNGADIVGAALEARIFQAQLNTHGGYVVVEDRFFPQYVKELLSRAAEAGEIHPSHNVEEAAQIILQTSRGILFDWSLRKGSFDVCVQAQKTLDLFLSALKHPKV